MDVITGEDMAVDITVFLDESERACEAGIVAGTRVLLQLEDNPVVPCLSHQ